MRRVLSAETCTGPQQGYKGHGDPAPDSDLLLVMTSASGEPVTSWDAGTEYTVTLSHPSIAFHAYIYASLGVPSCLGTPCWASEGCVRGFVAAGH